MTDAQPEYVCIIVFRKSKFAAPERCENPTVWGTPYCERHGGKADGKAAKARSKAARAVTGRSLEVLREAGLDVGQIDIINHPRPLDPAALLLEEVARSAGIIRWLEAKIAGLEVDDQDGGEGFITTVSTVTNEDKSGSGTGANGSYTMSKEERRKDVTIWWRLLQEERRIAQNAATAALRSNIEERRVRLAERSVNALEAAVAAALMDLGLNPHDERVRAVVGARLREALADGQDPFGMGTGGGGDGEGVFVAPSARVIEAAPDEVEDRPKPQDF